MTVTEQPGGHEAEAVPAIIEGTVAEIDGAVADAESVVEAAAESAPFPAIYADITSAERRPVIPLPLQRENLRHTRVLIGNRRCCTHGIIFRLACSP